MPRLEELIGASKNPKGPQTTIYLRKEFAQDEVRAQAIVNRLRQTHLRDVAKRSEIVYDPDDAATTVPADAAFLASYHAFVGSAPEACNQDCPWVLRVELDREKMLERDIRMWEVQRKLEERFSDELQCVFADDNAQELTVRVRVANDSSDDLEEHDVVFLLKQVDAALRNLLLRGLPGVRNAILPPRDARPCRVVIGPGGEYLETEREIVIVAEHQVPPVDNGLLEVMKLPEVDRTRTLSNYMHHVNHLLGIEAARALLARELHQVFSSSYINNRHIDMLVDTMTVKGDILAISRVGIHKLNVGPLARSSFEETDKEFTNAAAFAEVDNFRGVSANIMLGQKVPAGTGECDVLLDEQLLAEALAGSQDAAEEADLAYEAQMLARASAGAADDGELDFGAGDDDDLDDDAYGTPFALPDGVTLPSVREEDEAADEADE